MTWKGLGWKEPQALKITYAAVTSDLLISLHNQVFINTDFKHRGKQNAGQGKNGKWHKKALGGVSASCPGHPLHPPVTSLQQRVALPALSCWNWALYQKGTQAHALLLKLSA